ncbi:MAG: DUF4913 domain-containing protein [Angustibacter sp.]
MTEEAEPEQLYYGNLVEFFECVFRPLFRRQVGPAGRSEFRWSARWWESGEAQLRMDAMWRTWEAARLDPAEGMSGWLRNHADYHLQVLLSPHGPFAAATDANRPGEPLPHEAPPPGYLGDERD